MKLKPRLLSTIHIHCYSLLGLGSLLSVIHLTLLDRFAHANQFSSCLLLWVAFMGLIHQNWNYLKRGSSPSACLLGGMISLGLLVKAAMLSSYEPFLRLWPLLALLALALLISGWKGVGQYWREAIAWVFLSLPPGPILHSIDLTLLTAKLASFLLWYLGWYVSRQGSEIMLPTGTIAVLPGCSGVESLLQLLGLAVLFILFFSPGWLKSSLAIGSAIVFAISTNVVRVALMAILNAYVGKSAFEYWHRGQGSYLFSLLAVILFGTFCLCLLWQKTDAVEIVNSAQQQ